MAGRVAGQLLGVELARRGDEVVDRLVRLDPEHDRRVAELEVEVEQQRSLAPVLGERGAEVRRGDGLAGAALRREHGHEPAVPALGARQPLAHVAGLADREDDVVGELRQQQDVGDVVRRAPPRAEPGSRSRRAGRPAPACARGSRPARSPAAPTNAWRAGRPGGARPRASRRPRQPAPAEPTSSTSGWRPEGLPEIGQPVAVARDVDAGALAAHARCLVLVFHLGLVRHYWPPPKEPE